MTEHWQGTWNGISPDSSKHQRAREIVRSTGTIVRGKFPSRKMGRMIHHEGMLELDAIYLFETSPQVTSYVEQPETIFYPDDKRLRRYTPDFFLTFASNRSILVEVKPYANAEKTEMRHKLNCIEDHLKRQNREFLLLTDHVIRKEPFLSNAKWIYHRATRIHKTRLSVQILLAQVSSRFPLSFTNAIDLLRPIQLDPFTLILQGHLQCHLDQPLSMSSPVQLAGEI
jgi:hypothetical protein